MRAPAAGSRPARPYWALIVLTLAIVGAYMDRVVAYVLATSIAHDLQLSDLQLGAISSLAFTLVYALASLPLAHLADRHSRSRLLAAGALLWSVLTACGGLAQSFLQLAGSRVGIAVGEAVLMPAGTSLIADLFPPERRRLALSIFLAGGPLGVIVGLGAGGVLSDQFGWRTTLMLFAVPSLITAVLIGVTVREPRRGAAEQEAGETPPPFRELLGQVWRLRDFRHVLYSATLFYVVGAAINAFTPAYLIRTFGFSVSTVGLIVGVIFGLSGAIGAILGGGIADRLVRRHPRWALWVPALGLVAAVPFYLAAWLVPSGTLALWLLAPPSLLVTVFLGPVYAHVQALVPVRSRAMVIAILGIAMYGVGASLGGVAAGLLSDLLRATTSFNPLSTALSILTLGYLWSAGHLLLAARPHAGRMP